MNFKQPPSKLPTTLTCFTLSTGVSVAKITNTSTLDVHFLESLPHNITHLDIDELWYFRPTIYKYSSLTHLTINFNHSLEKLPHTLTLKLGLF
jgi:hypothetical protein